MTATAEPTRAATVMEDALRVAPVNWRHVAAWTAAGLCGATSVLLWLSPGAETTADLVAIKLVLSVALLGGAGVALMARVAPDHSEIEVDTIRREVRLMTGRGRNRTCLARTKFADLGQAEQHGDTVCLWDETGALLAEVCLPDPGARARLAGALQDAGKLEPS